MPVRPRISLLVPVITRLVYAAYAGLAIIAYQEAQVIFDGGTTIQEGIECNEERTACSLPIKFCAYETTTSNTDNSASFSGDLECMDPSLISNIVPVTAVVSLAAIILYVILDLVVRCRKGCCQAMGGVSAGVAAGFGVALSFLLFQAMWCFLTIGVICDFWEKYYTSIETEGRDFKLSLKGNQSFIWATGAAAVLGGLMTAIDAAVLARTMRTGAAKAPAGAESPTMTDMSSCSSEPTPGAPPGGCGAPPAHDPSAQQDDPKRPRARARSRCKHFGTGKGKCKTGVGGDEPPPVGGAPELRVNVSGSTSCASTPTPGQGGAATWPPPGQDGGAAANPFMAL